MPDRPSARLDSAAGMTDNDATACYTPTEDASASPTVNAIDSGTVGSPQQVVTAATPATTATPATAATSATTSANNPDNSTVNPMVAQIIDNAVLGNVFNLDSAAASAIDISKVSNSDANLYNFLQRAMHAEHNLSIAKRQAYNEVSTAQGRLNTVSDNLRLVQGAVASLSAQIQANSFAAIIRDVAVSDNARIDSLECQLAATIEELRVANLRTANLGISLSGVQESVNSLNPPVKAPL